MSKIFPKIIPIMELAMPLIMGDHVYNEVYG